MNILHCIRKMWKHRLDVVRILVSYFFSLILPIKANRVIIWSYNYTKYSCNPKYITEYLLKNKNDKYEIYWVFKKGIKVNKIDDRIKIIEKDSFKYLFILNTSKVVITNTRILWDSYFFKRNQYYIQTWHSAMRLKKIEKDAGDSLPISYQTEAQKDSKKCDLIISGSKFTTNTIKRAFWYDGDIIECGTPRNDLLFSENMELKNKIRKYYSLGDDKKIVLYAPTFRSNFDSSMYDIDYDNLLAALENKFGSKWVLFLRFHPNFLYNNIKTKCLNAKQTLDVTLYDDMQELLIAADLLITDYSSCMFDFALIEKKCILYASDYEDYDRGTYFKLKELPFPIATNNEEIVFAIKSFDEKKYLTDIRRFNENIVGYFENGTACEEVARCIDSACLI